MVDLVNDIVLVQECSDELAGLWIVSSALKLLVHPLAAEQTTIWIWNWEKDYSQALHKLPIATVYADVLPIAVTLDTKHYCQCTQKP